MFDNLAGAAIREQRVRLYLAGTQHLSIRDREGEPRSHLAVYVFPNMMRNLDSLAFSRCNWAPVHPSFVLLLPQFAAVTRVKLYAVKMQNFSDFRRVICAFPRLERLRIEGCSLKHYNPIHTAHAPGVSPVLVHLRRLELVRNDVQLLANLTQWIRILGGVESLHELALIESLRDTGFDLDALDHILRSVGPQLKSLSIDYPWINGTSYFPPIHQLDAHLVTRRHEPRAAIQPVASKSKLSNTGALHAYSSIRPGGRAQDGRVIASLHEAAVLDPERGHGIYRP